MKTLNEVVRIVGLSRRVIQEYESAGLAIKPNDEDRDKYKRLRYDQRAIERLWQLRFYKELGYDKKKIKSILSSSNYDKQQELVKTIAELVKEKEKLDNLIGMAQMIKETGISSNAFRFGIKHLEDASFDQISVLMGTMHNGIKSVSEDDASFDTVITEEVCEVYSSAFDKIMDLCEKGLAANSDKVQYQISLIHKQISSLQSKSIIFVELLGLFFFPGTESALVINEYYGKGKAAFFHNALLHYCKVNAHNEVDRKIDLAFENIISLAHEKHTPASDDVQSEVKEIFHLFFGTSTLSNITKLRMFKSMGNLYGSKPYINAFDNSATSGISLFLSRAILIYCDNFQID